MDVINRYVLCALGALFCLLEGFWLAYLYLAERRPSRPRPLSRSAACLQCLAVMAADAALVLLLLADDIDNHSLCRVAGVILMTSTVFMSFALAGSSVVSLLWRHKVTGPSWSRYIHWCCSLTGAVLACAVSLLPLMDALPMSRDRCVPVMAAGGRGHEYTALALLLCTIAVLVSTGASVAACRHLFRSSQRRNRFDTRDFYVNLSGVLIWSAVLSVLAWAYFSGGRTGGQLTVGSTATVPLVLAYSLIGYSAVHLIVAVGVTLAYRLGTRTDSAVGRSRRRSEGDGHSIGSLKKHRSIEMSTSSSSSSASSSAVCSPNSGSTNSDLPDIGVPPSDILAAKQFGSQNVQCSKSVHKYIITWSSQTTGHSSSGQLVVYPPCSRHVWSVHSTAIRRLGAYHPKDNRIVKHIWSSERNSLAHVLSSFTGNVISPYSSTVCTQHYPCGSLRVYLRRYAQFGARRRPDAAQHSRPLNYRYLAVDVTTALAFLHARNLVHNSLTAGAVYMEYSPEINSIRSYVGDFESCYDVTPSLLSKSSSLTSSSSAAKQQRIYSLTSSDNVASRSRFSPDMRSFALVLLEVIISMNNKETGELRQNQELQIDTYTSAMVTPLPDFKRLSSSEQILNSILRDIRGDSSLDKKISPRSVDGDNAYCLNSLDSVNSEKYLDKERLASCSAYNSKESLTDSQDNNCKSKFSTISSNNCFGTIYEDNSSSETATQATLRRRARMKSARRMMTDKAKVRLAVARRGYVPGACTASDTYSDTSQIYSDASSINGTRNAYSDSGVESSYQFLSDDISNLYAKTATPNSIAADLYVPLTVGPPGYEPPSAHYEHPPPPSTHYEDLRQRTPRLGISATAAASSSSSTASSMRRSAARTITTSDARTTTTTAISGAPISAGHYTTNSDPDTSSVGSLDVSVYRLPPGAVHAPRTRDLRCGIGRSQTSYYRLIQELADCDLDAYVSDLNAIPRRFTPSVIQTLLPLFDECWFEDTPPSSEDLLVRLRSKLSSTY